ncbi:F0F1 ATP synthase subunit A [Kaistella jeonii]|uniref:ATP synthase subunit a n=1 Tax=Kaistella jeonii TaxID=266749 RepID=A0A0C1DA10_9FLAO|nr:F0F1 ATP synthase subunit A [Kaistella jeonii]KIA90760.1 ATP synthase F0 subunit A [Kaistella jeonii]SFB68254.1 F-type H+-transporting ATPase subunit a [Kaistella jeonii]VEI94619.1 F-ATPase subunit 6 [Kaistella jeonii]
MLKRVVLIIGFLSTFSTSFAQHETAVGSTNETVGETVASKEVAAPLSEAEKIKSENKTYIDHHLLDAHSFDIMVSKNADGTENHIGFPLPVIFYDSANGIHAFMSSKFHHGEEVVESKGGHYALSHEKIYKTDANGTLNPNEEGHSTNEKVLDLSITKSVLMILITSLMLILIFVSIARSYKKSLVPSGAAKILEPVILFIRDDIAKPNIGANYKKYMGYLLTIFFFILFLNIFGLMPFGINVTGNIAITFALALLTFLITQFTANKNYWQHIFWMPGLPWPMKIVMMPIEIIGLFIKPFSLLIRLFANMSAGHIIVMSLIALIYYFQNVIAGIAFPFLTFVIYLLEVLVAFLQAYIFTMLSAVYFGMANEEHGHEGEEGMAH